MKFEEVKQALDSEVGYILMGVRVDGSTFAESKEAGVVIPLCAANASQGVSPKDIISGIRFIGTLTAVRQERQKRGPKVKRAAKEVEKPRTEQPTP